MLAENHKGVEWEFFFNKDKKQIHIAVINSPPGPHFYRLRAAWSATLILAEKGAPGSEPLNLHKEIWLQWLRLVKYEVLHAIRLKGYLK